MTWNDDEVGASTLRIHHMSVRNPLSRPHVLLSCATSLDGFIDDHGPTPLLLSGPADLDRVDALRAASDAVLVGAGTVRADDPRLLVRDPARVARRVAEGRGPGPAKVTLTASGRLEATARFFTHGDVPRLVYAAGPGVPEARRRVGHLAEVVPAGDPLDLPAVLADLAARGVRRLMVEGGTGVHTAFLAQGLADELHLVVAPVLVGSAGRARFTDPAALPALPGRAHLAGAETVGDCVLLRYTWSHAPAPAHAPAPPRP